MTRLNIPVLPDIVNAALITTIVSAGNAYMFNASRSLHSLALEGQAPKIFRRLNKQSVTPSHCLVPMVAYLFHLDSYLHTLPQRCSICCCSLRRRS